MIFVTVGTQLPFERLIDAVQAWAVQNDDHQVVAQIGADCAVYTGIQCHSQMGHSDFTARMAQADVVVAHAGMGSILMAAELGKPIIILPRLAALGEHRSDHQMDTAAKMASLAHVTVVQDAALIGPALDRVLAQGTMAIAACDMTAPAALLQAVQEFVWQDGSNLGPSFDMTQVQA